ncbi:Endosomal Na+/H+ exchanger [Marssonina coronariae]|uniref:Endosomal Na+/H+ exchanger n=1 Tax=Diplocarpon coronariae TaxID=2795749 RepID=A0A218ZCF4_9HELO|nr:Endosomal Na+/H+ exchanger [Marssonina coronariae]
MLPGLASATLPWHPECAGPGRLERPLLRNADSASLRAAARRCSPRGESRSRRLDPSGPAAEEPGHDAPDDGFPRGGWAGLDPPAPGRLPSGFGLAAVDAGKHGPWDGRTSRGFPL